MAKAEKQHREGHVVTIDVDPECKPKCRGGLGTCRDTRQFPRLPRGKSGNPGGRPSGTGIKLITQAYSCA
jgi:hypothetical protein